MRESSEKSGPAVQVLGEPPERTHDASSVGPEPTSARRGPDHDADVTAATAPTSATPPASAAGDRSVLRARVAVVIVTWNRKTFVSNVLGSLARQTYPVDRIDVTVVDNASTDGTLEFLRERWKPERVIDNPTDKAHEPAFAPPTRESIGTEPNLAGFASLTIVRNHHNHGGCGGFNTGFAYVEHAHAASSRGEELGYVWLVDDDIDLPEDALSQLTSAADADPSIGLVGSRTVDFNDRVTTIETTVYLDRATGRMCDEPPPSHPRHDSHRSWVATVGGIRGGRGYTGLRDVDVVSACSLLARWSGVKKVGFWDYRYFIYCDDADWSLRFAKAGYRVVLNLDAVVYHTPWHHKLTPARAYYAQRNALWMLQKILPPAELDRITWGWMKSVMKQSLLTGLHRRLFQADIMRRSISDMIDGRWGKLSDDGPKPEDAIEGLDRVGLLRRGREIAVMCPTQDCVHWGDELRVRVEDHLKAQGRVGDTPEWVYFVRNDVPDPGRQPGLPRRVVYSHRARSKIRRQITTLLSAPSAAVVFDQQCDFPLIRGAWNIHVDRRQPTKAQIEPAGVIPLAGFLRRWCASALRCRRFRSAPKVYQSATRYG